MDLQATKVYTKALRRLSPNNRRAVERTLDKLGIQPEASGLHVERVKGSSSDIFSVRVTQAIRLIFERLGEIIRLLYVGPHDEAYRRAELYYMAAGPRPATWRPDDEDIDMALTFPGVPDNFDEQISAEAGFADVHDSTGIILDVLGPLVDRVEDGIPTAAVKEAAETVASSVGGGPAINLIPSKARGDCMPVLLVICGDSDSFGGRLSDTMGHLAVCPDTRLVIFLTSKWDEKAWVKRQDNLAAVKARVCVFGKFARRVVLIARV